MKHPVIACLVLLCASSSGVCAADTPTAAPPVKDKSKPAQGGPATPTARGTDQLVLDATLVTGNRELPKVMYIVPWKKADLSNLPGQPFNTLMDEALAPVDREVFRREVDYYQVIADKDRAATPATDRK